MAGAALRGNTSSELAAHDVSLIDDFVLVRTHLPVGPALVLERWGRWIRAGRGDGALPCMAPTTLGELHRLRPGTACLSNWPSVRYRSSRRWAVARAGAGSAGAPGGPGPNRSKKGADPPTLGRSGRGGAPRGPGGPGRPEK